MADGPDKFDETAAPPASLLEPSRFTFAGTVATRSPVAGLLSPSGL